MESVIHGLRAATELVLTPFDLLPAWLSLTVIALLTALLMLVAVKRVSPQKLVERARDQMAGCIYEMRLFLDSPGRIVRAQGRLVVWMVVYLATLLPALVVLGPPLGLLYVHLETRHGLAPARVGHDLVARIELAEGQDGDALSVEPGPGLELTAPLVWAADESAVYARIKPVEPKSLAFTVSLDGAKVTKEVVADPAASVVAPDRQSGIAHLWSLGAEPPPGSAAIRAISIPHPAKPASFLHLAIPWWLAWLGLATVFALLLRRRFDVAF